MYKMGKLLKNVGTMSSICIPRNYLNGRKLLDVTNIDIHGFCNASGKAYAAVVYLRATFSSGEVISRFVASKTRVNPIKALSIPRLELMACLILSRLLKTVLSSLVDYGIRKVYCWTDSIDCFYWVITTGKVWNRFVQNRVNEIRLNLPDAEWKHCPGEYNPADIPSRGDYLMHDEVQKRWLEGPEFLLRSHEFWPKLPDNCNRNKTESTDNDNPMVGEVIRVKSASNQIIERNNSMVGNVISVNSVSNEVIGLYEVININSFKSFKRLVLVTCYV